MPTHPLARFFDRVDDVTAEIARREAGGVAHPAAVDDEVAVCHPKQLDLVVDEVITETATTKTFRLRRATGELLPPFQAGQYISLRLQIEGVRTSRAFSVSSSPTERRHYDLTVRRVPGGRVSNHLLDAVAPGDRLVSSGPIGTFQHNPLFHGEDLVFLAGGSGVAPAMSMIREVVDRGLPRTLHLVYGSRRADDIIFRAELDQVARDCPEITVDHVISEPDADWSGPTGFLSAAVVERLAGPLRGRMTYVCGPPAMYAYQLRQLDRVGHPRRRVRLEANGIALPAGEDRDWPADVDPTVEVTVAVRGRGAFRTPRSRPLLDALEDNGFQPEASCRSGECSMCRVRVVRGGVFTAAEARLRMSDRDFGFTHSCAAYPVTDVEVDF
ncbi:FAD-binding oxidoreductase [Salinispora arenicola]|uniref:Oxidoreductase FAD-binding domain protein n=1 Tax=Salinispora arenicola (strain CNS-205) TaxID=391037 RepID=A8M5A3_SALAI|nr:FAD-binding oxidoreductase [Salinispora arenicola]NIL56343.1 2Fe-2S iron-sulfur cluster binding domain-containing protein [Salinispora arenicola]NIL62460.1 2Fe-2S iron-sulfur cluster binding domain-containing protein [Salinispora arenicola]